MLSSERFLLIAPRILLATDSAPKTENRGVSSKIGESVRNPRSVVQEKLCTRPDNENFRFRFLRSPSFALFIFMFSPFATPPGQLFIYFFRFSRALFARRVSSLSLFAAAGLLQLLLHFSAAVVHAVGVAASGCSDLESGSGSHG